MAERPWTFFVDAIRVSPLTGVMFAEGPVGRVLGTGTGDSALEPVFPMDGDTRAGRFGFLAGIDGLLYRAGPTGFGIWPVGGLTCPLLGVSVESSSSLISCEEKVTSCVDRKNAISSAGGAT